MDAVVDPSAAKPDRQDAHPVERPSRKEAEDAVRTLIRWAGDDPDARGPRRHAQRVTKAWREMFRGYDLSAADELDTVFEEVGGYGDIVLLRDIPFYLPLRAPHRADPRQGAHRLLPARGRRRPVEARPASSTSSPGACRPRRT